MSTPLLDPETYELPPLATMLDGINRDADGAGCFWLHSVFLAPSDPPARHRELADGAIFIVKGAKEANQVFNFLANSGMLTPGKSIPGFPPPFSSKEAA